MYHITVSTLVMMALTASDTYYIVSGVSHERKTLSTPCLYPQSDTINYLLIFYSMAIRLGMLYIVPCIYMPINFDEN